MNIVVTGGAGFIGSHVVDKYIEAGHRVWVIDNLSTGSEGNINPHAEFIRLDVADPQISDLLEKIKPQVVNHHAAQISVPISVKDPIKDAETNVIGLLNLLEACVKTKAEKFIFISSGGAVYGEAEEYPTTESYEPWPLSPYAIHKFLGEKYLFYYRHQFGLKYTVLRYGNVFGPRQIPHGEAGVVSIFITNFKDRKRSILYAYPEDPDGMIRDYIYVKDVAQANLLALTRGTNDTVNIATQKETTTGELFRIIAKLMKVQPEADHGVARPGDIRRSCLNIVKASKTFGWKPESDLETGIKETIAYFINK